MYVTALYFTMTCMTSVCNMILIYQNRHLIVKVLIFMREKIQFTIFHDNNWKDKHIQKKVMHSERMEE